MLGPAPHVGDLDGVLAPGLLLAQSQLPRLLGSELVGRRSFSCYLSLCVVSAFQINKILVERKRWNYMVFLINRFYYRNWFLQGLVPGTGAWYSGYTSHVHIPCLNA